MNKLCGLKQMASADCSKWTASQFSVSDTLSSVLVCKQSNKWQVQTAVSGQPPSFQFQTLSAVS